MFAAVFLATSLSRLLYGIGPYDGRSFIAGPIVVACGGLVACLIPARRALRVDPLTALRYE